MFYRTIQANSSMLQSRLFSLPTQTMEEIEAIINNEDTEIISQLATHIQGRSVQLIKQCIKKLILNTRKMSNLTWRKSSKL
jgi:hypothetical protein